MFWFVSFCPLSLRSSFVFNEDMFQSIGEVISTAGVYRGSMFLPKKFLWRGKVYLIETITLISDTRDGQVRKRIYSVLCNKTLYRILFNRETEKWTLEELWME